MKKYAKQIMAWLCVMLMTVSMVVPAIADNGGNSNQKKEGVYITYGKKPGFYIRPWKCCWR